MEQSRHDNLAERIALLLKEELKNSENSDLRKSIAEIGERISVIETKLAVNSLSNSHKNSAPLHASQERFLDLEDIAYQVLDSVNRKEKACPYEPAGKPCDHCAMCSSRGF